MNWWVFCLTIGGVATGLTAIMTPLFRKLAWRLEILDKPLHEAHKRHQKATPLLGGVAILAGWLLTLGGGLLGAWLIRDQLPSRFGIDANGLRTAAPMLASIVGGAIAMVLLGLKDDRKPMSAKVKLAGQILICGLVALHPKMQLSLFVTQPVLTWGITVFWFLFIINAFNFFDNMDGLATGVAAIAAVLFTVVAAYSGQVFVSALGAATAGCAIGFYLYNRAPASIFMGDAGSHLLGHLLATMGSLTLFYSAKSPTISPLFMPLFILGMPIFDTFAVVIIRLRQGKKIYLGDHNHVSHRFRRMGMSSGTAVLLVHLLTLALGLAALPLLWLPPGGLWPVFLQAAAILTLISILHTIKTETR